MHPPQAAPSGLKSRFFGDYEILGEIARGGMGVVYRARQLGLNRIVALKMVQSHHLLSDEARLRFRVEIEAVAQLHHPHIVSLYESGEHDGAHFFTMRLVEGGDLGGVIQRQPPLRLLICSLVTICRAVHYAHQRGILHRDLKPSNILIDERGEPHVADFGLAKSLDQETGFTFTSSVLGSPNYMAPEQASGKGRQLTTAVDVYGLGAILYHVLAGRPPFVAATPVEILRQVMDCDALPPRAFRSATDPDLETIALKCLRKEPRERYGTADEVAQDLERWLSGMPILARPLSPLAAIRRWGRRRPVAAALSSALTLALMVIVLGASFGMVRIKSANERTEALMTRMQIQKAEDLFTRGETSKGLAMLAHVLRKEPTHNSAAQRALSTLQHRTYALPIFLPMSRFSPMAASAALAGCEELLTLGEEGQARRWNLTAGGAVESLFDLHRPIRTAGLSQEGSHLLIGFRDGTAQMHSGPALKTVHPLSVLPDGIVTTAFNSSGAMAAAVSTRLSPSFEARVDIWSTETGQPLIEPLPHSLLVTDLEFTPDGKHLVSVCADGRIRFWPLSGPTGSPSRVLTQSACLTLCFDPSGRWMAVGEYEGGIKVWDMQNPSQPKWAFQHARRITDLCFSPDASLLLSASIDDTAQVWNLASGTPHSAPLRHGNSVNSARFSPDARLVVTASSDNTARLWDTRTGMPVTEELPHENALMGARFTSDGRRVLTTSFSGAFGIWELREPFSPTKRFNHGSFVSQVQFSPDGTKMATGSTDGDIRITDVGAGAHVLRLRHEGSVRPMAFSPDGRILAVGGASGSAQLYDTSSGAPISGPLRHKYTVDALEFDRTGKRLLVTAEVQAQVWDVVNSSPVGASMAHRDVITCARFSPDARWIVSASKDRIVRLWSAETGQPVGLPLREGDQANSVQFSPDGKYVLIGGRAHEALVVSVNEHQEVGARMRHHGGVSRAAFSPDGKRIVTASEDRTAKVWALGEPNPLVHSLPHPARVSFAEFSSDGRVILTLSSEGAARLWDAGSGDLIADPIQLPGATFASLSSDGHHIALASAEGAVLLRTIPTWAQWKTERLINLAEQVARQRFYPPDRFDPVTEELKSASSRPNGNSSRDGMMDSMEQWFRNPLSSH